MEKYPTLSKAPITEALIDIQVKLPDNFDINKLDNIKGISADNTTKHELRRFESKFNIKDGQPLADVSNKILGYRYISSDNLYVFQARFNGFTLSRLAPYETWELFKKEGCRLWDIYSEITNPFIVRIAVRYINKIIIPFPIKDFGDYFTAPITVPEELPQGVNSYFNRVIINEPSIGASAIITNSMEPISKPDFVPIMIDIDVFKINTNGFEAEEIWNTLSMMRDFKNKIFYNTITDKLKEMFI